MDTSYLHGVGIGLLISWVTGAIAYYKAGASAFKKVILLEFALCVIIIAAAFLL